MSPESLIASSKVAAVVSDPRQPDNPIVACNEAFMQLTGYPKEEILGRNCRFLRGDRTEPVQTAMLREAVAELQDRGLLVARPNAGIFVADVLGSAFSPALVELFAKHDEAVFDYLAFRRDMEGLAAERAARLASDTDLAVIDAIYAKMEAAHQKRDPTDEAALDAEFHLAIIEASHNFVMLHMMRSMYDLLRQGVFYNRQVMFKNRLTRDMLLNQHRAINAAITDFNGVGRIETIETIVAAFDASDGTIAVPATMAECYRVEYQDADGIWCEIGRAHV